MKIKSLELTNFMKHDHTKFQFPDYGLILISGANGHGKSTILEGVAYGAWGKTLRGSPPWRNNTAGSLELIIDDIHVQRTITQKGSKKISWSRNSHKQEYETSSKAQDALENEILNFEVWRRTAVFSASDAAHFSTARDADRKRLLENILGLDRFDTALEECRKDLKIANTETLHVRGELMRLRLALESEERRLTEAQETLKKFDTTIDVVALKNQSQKFVQQLEEINEQKSTLSQQLYGDRRELELLKTKFSKINKNICNECGQPIAIGLRESLAAEINKKENQLQKSQLIRQDDLDELMAIAQELYEKNNAIQIKIAIETNTQTAFQYQKTIVQSASGQITTIKNDMTIKELNHQKLESVAKILEACEKVLDTKGVRAHILGKALTGVEAVANMWLGRLANQNLQVHLKPYKESTSGNIDDSISLEVDGAGEGYGYKAASNGERRRIDIAILFALAEISSAAYGSIPGTIFIDEAVDGLDEEGIQNFAEILEELSSERCVVLITHRSDLQQSLNPTQHWKVENGKVN